jgi:DUF917 family protein
MSDDGFALTEPDLRPLALGAALLGTGGGGNPHIGMLRVREALRRGAHVRVVPIAAMTEDAWIGAVGGIGAPVVGMEKIKQGEESLRALRAVENAAGVRISALISAEIGGANAMEPIVTAAQAGLPVIDGDGMGRAFPELQMTTFFIYGQAPSPAAIADDKGNVVVFRDVVDMYWLERFARHVAVDMGAGAGFALPPLAAGFVRETLVPGTVSEALAIGRALLAARAARQDVVARLADALGARVLFTGKVTDVRRELRGGFAVGAATLAGVEAHAGATARIDIQNENLVLLVDGVAVAMVPDLIINITLDTGEPVTTETLRFGQRLAVLGRPAHRLMTTPAALRVVGPAAFGYTKLVFTPLAGGR